MKMIYSGIHISGDGMGKELGFPTINVDLYILPPEKGVFLTKVFIIDKEYYGLIHMGPRPTFHIENPSIEIFLFQTPPSQTHGKRISFILVEKIRDVIAFANPSELISQITKDVTQAKELIRKISLRKSL